MGKTNLFVVMVAASIGCSGANVVPSGWPDGSADKPVASCVAACANLRALGCPEGLDVDCPAVCERTQERMLTDLNVPCLTAASSKEDVRSCTVSVRCP